MKLLSATLICFVLTGFSACEQSPRTTPTSKETPSKDTAWFEFDDEVSKLAGQFEGVNKRILDKCNGIELLSRQLTANYQITEQNNLFHDVQYAKHVCNAWAMISYEISFISRLQGKQREEFGYNLTNEGYGMQAMIDDANLQNDGLIQTDRGHLVGLKQLLVGLRTDMDDAHALVSRLKCEANPQPPIHLYAVAP